MGDLSKHFSKVEFRCPCFRCRDREPRVSMQLIEKLEELRTKIDKPIRITSGQRCPEHNREVGGAPLSQHIDGTGCDIAVSGMPYADLLRACEEVFASGGVGSYTNDGHVHVDVRGRRARWQK